MVLLAKHIYKHQVWMKKKLTVIQCGGTHNLEFLSVFILEVISIIKR